jgi:hypothetical protein
MKIQILKIEWIGYVMQCVSSQTDAYRKKREQLLEFCPEQRKAYYACDVLHLLRTAC